MQESEGVERKARAERAATAKIKRLTREIAEIELAFHGGHADDPSQREYELEVRRDDLVRASVLHLHTAIEQLMDTLIMRGLLKVVPFGPSNQAQALRRMLSGGGSLGFDMKLNLAVALGVMKDSTRKKLMELNTLRNRCSHHHALNGNVRKGKRPGQKKPPLLNFRGQHLHSPKVFRTFADEYWDIWSAIYQKTQTMPLNAG